jgi:hypothetical protein
MMRDPDCSYRLLYFIHSAIETPSHCCRYEVSDENPVGQVLVYIASDDIDADLESVEKLRGSVVRAKTEIPGTGWYGLFKDPTGNTLALYTSLNPRYTSLEGRP